ncbi:hypothetical protein CBR_g48930 [Chara braunii]|uniref:DUF659 domain-containing protein n=1 Tax=Chara braunii TaxID=69332 RepID=A0A388M410_CHABU|nr:hypothetical protein CBR_g48930 [Chara braunii]|eukprot:GBG89222.1 hypothetical protein CBR_g48930 [Chara braunii]
MNYILARRSKPIFVKCEDVSEGDKDAVVVVAGWKRFFREWGVEKITTICADSFAGNKSAARMLREDPEFNQIYWIPCTTHCMDLLMHGICNCYKEWAAEVINRANKVVNFFRVHRWPRSHLRTQLLKYTELKATCLLRPASTRFGTHYVMLHRLQVCEKVLVRIVTGRPWEDMMWRGDIRLKAYAVEEFILDKAFWAGVKKLTTLMKGPYDVPREVDKDVHYLSRIYDMARRLQSIVRPTPLTVEERDAVLADVGKRTDMLLSPIHAVARLLDPHLRDVAVFSNVDLMAQFDSVVERLIDKKGSKMFDNCKDQLYDFQFGRGLFGDPAVVRRAAKDNPVLWWEVHGAGHPDIKELAVKVSSIWTTSSPAERNWSTWALVQTKSRNTLHHQGTEKLVYSHWSLRLKNKGDDGPTIVGGWLGLEKDWADEDLEGDMANVTNVVDDSEVGVEGTSSVAGSTNIVRDPPTRSASVQRLEDVEEAIETDKAEDDVDDDLSGKDDIPGEEWVDERSDSDRSWTRREEILPYMEGTGFSHRLKDQRVQRKQQEHHDEDRQEEDRQEEEHPHQQQEEDRQTKHPQEEHQHISSSRSTVERVS